MLQSPSPVVAVKFGKIQLRWCWAMTFEPGKCWSCSIQAATRCACVRKSPDSSLSPPESLPSTMRLRPWARHEGAISNPPSLRASTQPLTTGGCLARKIGSAKDRRNAGRLGGRGASAGLRNWPLRRRLAASQPPVIIILAIQIVSVKSIGSRPANAGKMPELRFKVARTLVMIAHS